MNYARTHTSSALAFPRTASYACAVEVHLCFSTRVARWLRMLITGVVL